MIVEIRHTFGLARDHSCGTLGQTVLTWLVLLILVWSGVIKVLMKTKWQHLCPLFAYFVTHPELATDKRKLRLI